MAEMSAAMLPSASTPSSLPLTPTLATPATPTPAPAPAPLSTTRTTTPRDLPTMYHFDFFSNVTNNDTISHEEAEPAVPPEVGSGQLSPCPICSRTFNLKALEKHIVICEKMASKKRKKFDSSRQRREGTELATYVLPKNFGLPNASSTVGVHSPPQLTRPERGQSPSQQLQSPVLARRKSNQQEDSARSTARNSMRKAANNTSTNTTTQAGGHCKDTTSTVSLPAQATEAAAPSTAQSSNFTRDRPRASIRTQQSAGERCPHCDRSFGIKAFDRHVEWCKEKSIQVGKKNTTNEQSKAKERMEARKQYRPPNLKTKRSMNREKYSGAAGDDCERADSPTLIMQKQMSVSMMSESGLNDKYDPFLSAKRQLEDLCAPALPTDSLLNTPLTPTTPNISIPTKMSTSLTLGTSAPQCSVPAMAQSHIQVKTTLNGLSASAAGAAATTKSNFRRTSSLRGPRRSPMLPSRPLFTHNYRPTIQRGLSDEGPISTNFLKPEEYDEMPVRSVCVNDFALTNSPRVVRRDTSASNRKEKLKLPLTPNSQTGLGDATNATAAAAASGATGAGTAESYTNAKQEDGEAPAKYVSKTDSLAVFLKYEHELEKLNAAAAAVAAKPMEASAGQNTLPSSQFSSKELKDKSNTLNKQNSAKSLKLEILQLDEHKPVGPVQREQTTPISSQLPILAKTTTSYEQHKHHNNCKENNENLSNNYTPLRLEPISSKPCTPKAATPLTKPTTPASKPGTPLIHGQQQQQQQQQPIYPAARPTQLPALIPQPTQHQHQQQQHAINLNAIFGDGTTASKTTSSGLGYNKERKYSTDSDYIDPKLINKCDNLPMQLRSISKSSDSEGMQDLRSDTSSTSDSSGAAPVSQLTKLLPLSRQQQQQQQQQEVQEPQLPALSHSSSTASTITQVSVSVDKRNSAEGRNLLKRKMRLGRNQFLYDASPEPDSSCCSADDEANRSSMEYDVEQFKNLNYRLPQQQQQQPSQPHKLNQKLLTTTTTTTTPIVPPLPIFDDFDFEEFLSSFENDDEQFPLFKDCREFLMNRTTSKQRSLLTSNSPKINNNNNNNNTNNSNTTAAAATTQMGTSATNYNNKPLNTNSNNNNNNNNTNITTSATPSAATATATTTPTRTTIATNAFLTTPQTHFQFPNKANQQLITSTPNNQQQSHRSGSSASINSDMLSYERYLAEMQKQQTPPSPSGGSSRNHNNNSNCNNNKNNNNSNSNNSHNNNNNNATCSNDQKKREIFICIETEQNELGRSPISPESLRHMVGNATTHVEVCEVDGSENKFSRISDDDVGGDGDFDDDDDVVHMMSSARSSRSSRAPPTPAAMFHTDLQKQPNVQFNNAKNLMQQMQNDFRQLGGEQAMIGTHHSRTTTSGMQSQSAKVTRSPHLPSGDSDELSSLDSYPISSSQSSRRGVGSKMSSDSAYGSLSRQRSSELMPNNVRHRSRPFTATGTTTTTAAAAPQAGTHQSNVPNDAAAQVQCNNYMPTKSRQRRFSGGSTSSGSENSMSPGGHVANNKNNNNNNSGNNGNCYQQSQSHGMHYGNNPSSNHKLECAALPSSTHSLASNASATLSHSNANYNSNPAMTTSMKMSKFCHECGTKFVIDHAKFCIDCGVKRVVL